MTKTNRMTIVTSVASATALASVSRRNAHVGHDGHNFYCSDDDGSHMFRLRKAAIFRPSIS